MESKELEAILDEYMPDGWNGNMLGDMLSWHTAEVERAKKAAAAEALRNVAGVFRESDEISDSTEAEKYARTLDRYAEQLQLQTKKGQI